MKCFTISKDTFSPGIAPARHDCIVSTGSEPVENAVVRMVPVLPYAQESLQAKAQLSLSFVLESADDTEPGCVVSLNPREWNVCLAVNPVVLLDPCGPQGHALVLLPPSGSNLLVSMDNPNNTLCTDELGRPVIRSTSRAMLMLAALGVQLDATGASAAPRSQQGKASPKGKPAGRRRIPRAEPEAAKALARTSSTAS